MKNRKIDAWLDNLTMNSPMCILVVETTLLHSHLPKFPEMGDIGEHLHHLLALEEEGIQDMIIIGD